MADFVGTTPTYAIGSTSDVEVPRADLPVGWQPGDLLICVVGSNFRDYFDPPAGWSHAPNSPSRSGGADVLRVTGSILYRISQAGDDVGSDWVFPRTAWQSGTQAGATAKVFVYSSEGEFQFPSDPFGNTAYQQWRLTADGNVIGRSGFTFSGITADPLAFAVIRKQGIDTASIVTNYTERFVSGNFWVADWSGSGSTGDIVVSDNDPALMDAEWQFELLEEPGIVFRMRAFDSGLGRIVYWDASTPDLLGNEYAGPGPLQDVVVSNEEPESPTYRMRAFDQTLGRTVYWNATINDQTGSEYTGPGPLIFVAVVDLL